MNTFYFKRREYWDYFMKLSDFRGIFYLYDRFSDADKKKLFAKLVCVVNLELSTYCNRKCSYCPLSLTPPTHAPRLQEYMSKSLFVKIIEELSEIDYRGYVILNFYNEPLLDKNLSEKISYIRKNLPNAWILFNSNGDFLTASLLRNLYESGLNQITVTLHTLPNQPYKDSDRRNAVENFLRKISLDKYFASRIEIPDKSIMLDISLSQTEKIFVCTNNWEVYGNDRGGTLEKLRGSQRVAPCVNPFREISVAYDGTIKPCCNIYFNSLNIYGNANEKSLTEIYFGKELCKFRRELFTFSRKFGGCATCNTEDNAKIEEQPLREKILSRCCFE